jgi:hypothetical protein
MLAHPGSASARRKHDRRDHPARGDRRDAIQGIAAKLAVELPGNWRPQSPHRKQADELNRAWADALRASVGR